MAAVDLVGVLLVFLLWYVLLRCKTGFELLQALLSFPSALLIDGELHLLPLLLREPEVLVLCSDMVRKLWETVEEPVLVVDEGQVANCVIVHWAVVSVVFVENSVVGLEHLQRLQ